VILLGAGESKRMGVNKLLLPWGKKIVLTHCADTLLHSTVKEVVIVLSDRTKVIENQFKGRKIKVVVNSQYRRGMSASIQKGIRAIAPNSHGILIALGDMPFLRSRTVNSLIRAFSHGKGTIIVPSFLGRQGHPVIFHVRFKKELLRLKGDAGGRSIIERYPKEVKLVRIRSEGVVKDIDTWRDYKEESSRRKGFMDSREALCASSRRSIESLAY
jgi:molybdenum cofactor cytidylyltransferase